MGSPNSTRMARLFGVHRGEWRGLLVAFGTFFSLLCGYYMVRPIRETMAVTIGTRYGHWLFTGTFLAMLAATPLFGWVASMFARRRFVPAVFWLFALSLIVFSETFRRVGTPAIAAALFYMWISVANYFLVSLFWSVMADIFQESQGRRLFPLIAAGGSLGAIAGSFLTSKGVSLFGQPGILWVAAFILGLVPFGIHAMWPGQFKGSSHAQIDPAHPAPDISADGGRLGGDTWEGVRQTLRSSFLLGIGFYTLLAGIVGSTIYLMQNAIVESSNLNPIERTQFFAGVDWATNVLTLVLELFLAGPLMRIFGVAPSLVALPLVALVGLPLQALFPSLSGIAYLQIVRRATEYAIAKPAREVLFTVVPPAEKYKAKNFIDTVLARSGDMISSWSRALLSMTRTEQSLALPLAALVTTVFGILGWMLALGHRRHLARQCDREAS